MPIDVLMYFTTNALHNTICQDNICYKCTRYNTIWFLKDNICYKCTRYNTIWFLKDSICYKCTIYNTIWFLKDNNICYTCTSYIYRFSEDYKFYFTNPWEIATFNDNNVSYIYFFKTIFGVNSVVLILFGICTDICGFIVVFFILLWCFTGVNDGAWSYHDGSSYLPYLLIYLRWVILSTILTYISKVGHPIYHTYYKVGHPIYHTYLYI